MTGIWAGIKRAWNSGDEFEFSPIEEVANHAKEYLEGRFDVTPPRFASSVMIVRDSRETQGVEVFMLKRASTMAFMPNALVFPGGRVDEKDAEADLPWAGPAPAEWAELMGVDERTARLLVVAAAREVFEECGVLLAGPDETSVVENLHDPIWRAERDLLEKYEITFSEVLHKHGLVLRSDLLALKSNWLTPECEPRRYDTYFFAAHLPHGQSPDGDTSEAVSHRWVLPDTVFDESDAGTSFVLPPTLYQLSLVREASSAEEFASKSNATVKIMMKPHLTEEGGVVMTTLLP